MKEYDVVISGAGPTGSSCAKALKDEGIDCIILEKARLPRNKMCSGILFGQTQMLLKKYFGDLPPEELYCDPKIIPAQNILEWDRERGFVPYIWEIPKHNVDFPKEYLNIWRRDFDYWLLEQSGAPVRDRVRVKEVEVTDHGVRLRVFNEAGDSEQIYCSYLVGADGMASRIRQAIDPSWVKKTREVPSYQAYYRFKDLGDLQGEHWYVFLEKDLGDVISCVHRKDEFLTMYVGNFGGRSLKKCMERFRSFLKTNFGVEFGDMKRDEGCIYKLSPPFLGKGRILLAGDAAGLVYLNGEGISVAIDSGWRVGKAIAKGIKENKEPLPLYQSSMVDILRHMELCLKKMHFVVN